MTLEELPFYSSFFPSFSHPVRKITFQPLRDPFPYLELWSWNIFFENFNHKILTDQRVDISVHEASMISADGGGRLAPRGAAILAQWYIRFGKMSMTVYQIRNQYKKGTGKEMNTGWNLSAYSGVVNAVEELTWEVGRLRREIGEKYNDS